MYFSKLNENNIVEQVIVADQNFIDGQEGNWIQTDINGVSPKNYPGIGYLYNEELNGFIAPQRFNSWSLNEGTCRWEPPISRPNDGKDYRWDEDTISWKLDQ